MLQGPDEWVPSREISKKVLGEKLGFTEKSEVGSLQMRQVYWGGCYQPFIANIIIYFTILTSTWIQHKTWGNRVDPCVQWIFMLWLYWYSGNPTQMAYCFDLHSFINSDLFHSVISHQQTHTAPISEAPPPWAEYLGWFSIQHPPLAARTEPRRCNWEEALQSPWQGSSRCFQVHGWWGLVGAAETFTLSKVE